MRCGDFFLVGCFGYAHHAPDESHYIQQIEEVFDKGFVDEELRDEALSKVGSFRWGRGYGGRELCAELREGWRDLETVHESLSVAWWYAQIEKYPAAGVKPLESPLLNQLRKRLWHESGFRCKEGAGWEFVGSNFRRFDGPTHFVCEMLRHVGPRPVGRGLIRGLRRAQQQAYSPDCRPGLTFYFAAVQNLREEVTCPPVLIERLKRRGLGLSSNPHYGSPWEEWGNILQETKRVNYGE